MTPRPRWTLLGALGALTLAAHAHAQDAGEAAATPSSHDASDRSAAAIFDGGEPAAPTANETCTAERFVMLAFAPDIDPLFAREVHTDLAAELGPRGLTLCSPGSTSRASAATVQVRISHSVAMIELDDHLTHKRVARDLALSTLPQNGRALATAIAIDELLRASWAELTLRRERPTSDEAPSEPPRAPKPAPPPPAAEIGREHAGLPLLVGAHAGYLRTNEDFNAFSLHARASLRPRFGWFVLSAGPLVSLTTHTPLGEVHARGVGGTLTVGACSDGAARVFACGGGRAGVDWLRFRGRRPRMAEGLRDQTTLIHVSGVAQLAGRISPQVHVFGEFALGAMVRGARITDGTTPLSEVTGMLMALQVGLGVEL